MPAGKPAPSDTEAPEDTAKPANKPPRSDDARSAEKATKANAAGKPAADAPSAPVTRLEPISGSGGKASAGDDIKVAVVPGITRYHRTDCLLIRFLTSDDLDIMSRQAAKDGGCVPCKACKPEQQPADAAVG